MPLAPDAAVVEQHALAASLGDPDALALLYEQYAPYLIRVLEKRIPRDPHLVDEIASAAWEKVARNIRSYETKRGEFQRWLVGIALNEFRLYFRGASRRRAEELTGDLLTFEVITRSDIPGTGGGDPDVVVEQRLLAAELAAEVNSLSAQQRRCVQLRFFLGYDVAETAELMGRTPGAIKQLQHRAMATLNNRVGDRFDGYRVSTTAAHGVPDAPQLGTTIAATSSLQGGSV